LVQQHSLLASQLSDFLGKQEEGIPSPRLKFSNFMHFLVPWFGSCALVWSGQHEAFGIAGWLRPQVTENLCAIRPRTKDIPGEREPWAELKHPVGRSPHVRLLSSAAGDVLSPSLFRNSSPHAMLVWALRPSPLPGDVDA
jgi:hypothetical protein